jgi:hypothetical protein
MIGMAQEKIPYNAEVVAKNTNIIQTVIGLHWKSFGPGTEKGAPTKADLKIWSETAKFNELARIECDHFVLRPSQQHQSIHHEWCALNAAQRLHLVDPARPKPGYRLAVDLLKRAEALPGIRAGVGEPLACILGRCV